MTSPVTSLPDAEQPTSPSPSEEGPSFPSTPSWPSTVAEVALPPHAAEAPPVSIVEQQTLVPPDPLAVSAPAESAPVSEAADSAAVFSDALPQPILRQPRGSRWGTFALVALVIPLISYAVLATILILVLRQRLLNLQERHPLEEMLDHDGDFKGATRLRQQSSNRKGPPSADNQLPAHLRVPLGQTIRIGDLDVTPEQVELAPVTFRTSDGVHKGRKDSLVLRLLLRNTSADVVFSPTDPHFYRRWKRPEKGIPHGMPYTYVELGKDLRLHGGPSLDVYGRKDGTVVEGQELGKQLKPGEEQRTFICTDPEDDAGKLLETYQGPCLWRVQLRRGLVTIRERDYPATAVIGVEFAPADVKKP